MRQDHRQRGGAAFDRLHLQDDGGVGAPAGAGQPAGLAQRGQAGCGGGGGFLD
jgi:hypothetical protein